MTFHFTVGFVAYFVLGYVLAHCVDLRKNIIPTALGLTITGTILVFLEIKFAVSKEAATVFMKHYQLGVLMQTSGLFLLARQLSEKRMLTAMAKISPLTLGIYMLHPIIIEILQRYGVTSLSFSPFISIPVISLGIFIVSAGTVCMIKLTPLERMIRIGGAKI